MFFLDNSLSMYLNSAFLLVTPYYLVSQETKHAHTGGDADTNQVTCILEKHQEYTKSMRTEILSIVSLRILRILLHWLQFQIVVVSTCMNV